MHFQRHYKKSPLAHQMSSVQMRLYHLLYSIRQQPEPSIWLSCTSYLSHRSSQPRLPSLLMSIHQALAAFADYIPSNAVSFWILCLSASQVRHLCSVCPALHLLHHHSGVCHLGCLQEHSDYLRMVFSICFNDVCRYLVVNPPFPVFVILSGFYLIAVSASSTHFLATAVALST